MKIAASVLLLLTIGPSLAQEATLTIEVPATGISRAVALIAEKTGQKLEVAPAVASAVVAIRTDKAPLEEVLSKLALVSGGVWETGSDGIRRLVRDRDRHYREEREDRDARAARILKAIRNLEAAATKEAKPTKEGEPEQEDLDEGFAAAMGFPGSGSGRARDWAALARVLNVGELANLPPKARLVFATNPNRSQRALNVPAIGAIVEGLIAQHNQRAQAMGEGKGDEGEEAADMQKALEPMLQAMGIELSPKPIDSPPAKVLFIVERGGGMGFLSGGEDSLTLGLKLFDAQGRQLLRASRGLVLGRFGEAIREGIQALGKDASKPKPSGDTFELAPTTVELRRLADFSEMGGTGVFQPPSEALQKLMLQPELHDPLGFYWSEGLLATARHRGVNLVANLPDSLVEMTAFEAGDPKPTYDAFWSDLAGKRDLKVSDADGWILVQPAHPHEARIQRLDRVALGKLLRAALDKELPGLDDVADYASKCPPPMEAPIAMPYLLLYASNLLQQGMMPLNWDVLRLYGTLGPAQRQALRSGASIPFSALLPVQSAQVRAMAFGSGAKLDVTRESDPPKADPDELGWMGMFTAFLPRMGADFLDEPTEVMPDGLPAMGSLSISVKSEPFVCPLDEKGRRHRVFGALGATEMALFKGLAEDPNMAAMAQGIPQFTKFLAGEREVLNLKLQLGPRVSMGDKMYDHRMPKGGSAVAWEALPQPFLALVQKRIEAFKKNPFPFMPGMGRSTTPP